MHHKYTEERAVSLSKTMPEFEEGRPEMIIVSINCLVQPFDLSL